MNRIQLIPINKRSSKILVNSKPIGILSENTLKYLISDTNNTVITDKELNNIIEEIENYAWNKLLNYLARRDYSELEIKTYLKRQLLSADMIARLIDRAKKYNYINDERFAKMYALSLYENQKSEKYTYHKLKEKGIDEIIIDKVLAEYDFDNEKRLQKIIKKTIKKYEGVSDKQKYEKTLTYLVRNGFEYETVKDKVYQNIFMKD